MFDILLFDLDGTLTDPKEGITKCVAFALEACGIIVDDLDELECFIGPPLMESFMDFYGLSEDESAFAITKYRERFSETGIFENRLFEGIPKLLCELKENKKTVVLATSKPLPFAKRIIEHFGIDGYFDLVCGSGLNRPMQTKADVISEALSKLGSPDLNRVVMIGDREHDVIGAKQCGVCSIGLKLGYARPGELERAGADMTANDIGELKRLILQ